MKYLLLFLLSLSVFFFLVASAGKEMPKIAYCHGYDFTKYTANGFLFTPEPFNGDYDAIGLIELAVYPEVKKNKKKP